MSDSHLPLHVQNYANKPAPTTHSPLPTTLFLGLFHLESSPCPRSHLIRWVNGNQEPGLASGLAPGRRPRRNFDLTSGGWGGRAGGTHCNRVRVNGIWQPGFIFGPKRAIEIYEMGLGRGGGEVILSLHLKLFRKCLNF